MNALHDILVIHEILLSDVTNFSYKKREWQASSTIHVCLKDNVENWNLI